ncbi:MAG: hypothetical protein IT581_11015 [Verrucomicrobiales bacterium]|nr:hypothetical protein [Verrucomicrobiales bacterium]
MHDTWLIYLGLIVALILVALSLLITSQRDSFQSWAAASKFYSVTLFISLLLGGVAVVVSVTTAVNERGRNEEWYYRGVQKLFQDDFAESSSGHNAAESAEKEVQPKKPIADGSMLATSATQVATSRIETTPAASAGQSNSTNAASSPLGKHQDLGEEKGPDEGDRHVERSNGNAPGRLTTYATVMIIAFFTGGIRLLFEMSKDPRAIFSNLWNAVRAFLPSKAGLLGPVALRLDRELSGIRSDAWLAWFVLATLMAIIPMPKLTPLALALLVTFVGCLGFLCWIYMTIFNQLVFAHQFTEESARSALGQMILGPWAHTPRQAVVIGPNRAGKTVFIKALKSTKATLHSEIWQYGQFGSRISVIDVVGEQLGDHLILISEFRTDTVVMVLDARELGPPPADGSLVSSHLLADTLFGSESDPRTNCSRKYVENFLAATHSDTSNIAARHYKVGSFVLYLNAREGAEYISPGLVGWARSGALQRAASALGERLGVPEDHCCGIVADATNAGRGRDLLTLELGERRARIADA